MIMPKLIVLKTLRDIRDMGMSAKYSDGEYRVNYPKGAESTAYYTSEASDAVGTARVMARSKTMRQKNGRFGIFGS